MQFHMNFMDLHMDPPHTPTPQLYLDLGMLCMALLLEPPWMWYARSAPPQSTPKTSPASLRPFPPSLPPPPPGSLLTPRGAACTAFRRRWRQRRWWRAVAGHRRFLPTARRRRAARLQLGWPAGRRGRRRAGTRREGACGAGLETHEPGLGGKVRVGLVWKHMRAALACGMERDTACHSPVGYELYHITYMI
eukprot:365938-Chlamydomonas_euryale.AAC.2